MSSTKSLPQNSQNGTGQSDQQPLGGEPKRRPANETLDEISNLIGGGLPSDASKDKKESSKQDRSARRDDPDDAATGREKPLASESRPGLELDADEDAEDEEKPKKKAKGKAIKQFAEEHELDAEELYSLLVPSDDPEDEPKTVGQLKDAYREIKDHQRIADAFEDAKAEAMNQIFVGRQQIDGMLGRLHGILGDEKMAEMFDDVSQEFANNVRKAKEQVREFFPEWHDPQRYERDRKSFRELMATYGFKGQEVDSVIDARLIKFGIDAMRLMDRYKRLKENFTREQKVTKEPPSMRRIKSNPTREADRLAEKGDTIGAVDALIQGTSNVSRQPR